MNYNLDRFKYAQESRYGSAYEEIKNGEKTGHWMWFIFPQLSGLGISSESRQYAIQNLDEAYEYLTDEILSSRLCELTEILIFEVNGKTSQEIFGFTDSRKFHSCMTLFYANVSQHKKFHKEPRFQCFEHALNTFFDGRCDHRTLEILKLRDLRYREVATENSWNITPINKPEPLEINFQFTQQEYSLLIRGLIPNEMEERWFIYHHNGWLYFHRSWTGYGIYKAQLISTGEFHSIDEFFVERDNFESTTEREQYDRETFTALIGMLLEKMKWEY